MNKFKSCFLILASHFLLLISILLTQYLILDT
ncbi:MAG: hypothetical protein IPH74_00280 [Bacteroidetes bacterium]|nr:hypothetical protein [Bacteroidota bacterium]